MSRELDRIIETQDAHTEMLSEHELSIHGNPKDERQPGIIKDLVYTKALAESHRLLIRKILWMALGAGAGSGSLFATIAHYVVKYLNS